jgi:stage V sporulation protein G
MSINGLEVTDVLVFPVKKKSENSCLAAFARLVVNDCFIVSGIRILEGRNGPFVAFPQETSKNDGKSFDIAFPITAELRTYLCDQILIQYSISLQAIAA